jgi:hypothetical protein
MPDLPEEVFVVRFLIDSHAEELAYVDVEFGEERQAKKAMNTIISANGALVSIDNGSGVPILLRSSHVVAAYVIDENDAFDDDEEDDEKDDEVE